MGRKRNPETARYEIVKYDHKEGVVLEILPHKEQGAYNARNLCDKLNKELERTGEDQNGRIRYFPQ